MLNQLKDDPYLFQEIIWTDEANFKLFDHINRYKCVYWDTGNPHITLEPRLNQLNVRVWGSTSSSGVFGPHSFEGTVAGDNYLDMLQNAAVSKPGMHRDDFNILF
jgi:hypothetical protein